MAEFQVSLVVIFALCFAYEGLIAFRSRYDSYISDSSIFPLETSTKSYPTLFTAHKLTNNCVVVM